MACKGESWAESAELDSLFYVTVIAKHGSTKAGPLEK